MSNTSLLLLILCLFGASYLPRLFPMLYFSQRQVPQWFSDWMKYVPISLFAALVFKDVFISANHFDLIGNVRIIADASFFVNFDIQRLADKLGFAFFCKIQLVDFSMIAKDYGKIRHPH